MKTCLHLRQYIAELFSEYKNVSGKMCRKNQLIFCFILFFILFLFYSFFPENLAEIYE
jgi:hypothetical protein